MADEGRASAAEEGAAAAGHDGGDGEDHQHHPRFFVPRGVLSTSETCYFGAVLQALAASPSVIAYFKALAMAIGGDDEDKDADADDANDADDATRAPLALALARLIEQLSTPPPPSPNATSPVDPSAALDALSKHHRDFAAAFEGEHQDAAEALEAALNAAASEARAWLRRDAAALLSSPGLAAVLPDDEEEEEDEERDEEAAAAPSVPPPSAIPQLPPRRAPRSLAEAADAAAKAAAAATAQTPEPNSELLEIWSALASPPLEGQLLHLRACLSCGNRAERALAPFFVLPLPVPAAAADDQAATTTTTAIATVRPGATLDQCMRLFTAQELLSGVRCARCDLRRALAGAERAAALVLPPPTPTQAEARRELQALAAGGGGGVGGPLADDDVVDLRALARRAGLPLGLGGGGGGGRREGRQQLGNNNNNSNPSALRQTVICRAPPVLALQLLRARPGQRKLHGRIAYAPLIDLSGFVLAGEERAAAAAAAAAAGDVLAAAAAPSLLYELVAVVQHLGVGTGRGHYVTYRRVGGGGGAGGGWVRANDARVDRCSEKEALGCDGAALLVYERVELFAGSGALGGGVPLVGGG